MMIEVKIKTVSKTEWFEFPSVSFYSIGSINDFSFYNEDSVSFEAIFLAEGVDFVSNLLLG